MTHVCQTLHEEEKANAFMIETSVLINDVIETLETTCGVLNEHLEG